MYGVANTELENEKNNFYYSKINKGKILKFHKTLPKICNIFWTHFANAKCSAEKQILCRSLQITDPF